MPIDSSYKLVFDDEFNQTAIDTDKWVVLTNDSIGGGYTKNQFLPSHARQGGGFLALLCSRQARPDRPYRGGFIVGKQAWSYGYWEIRAKMPAHGHGAWPAFWMNHGGTYPEIDVFEWLGNDPTHQAVTYHPSDDAALTGGSGFGRAVGGPDFAGSFHVYGMLWQPAAITWYLDGEKVFQLTQGQQYNGKTVDITGVPMETILTAAIGGWNNNVPDAETVFPTGFLVDYIHIYSNRPGAVAVTPQVGYGGAGDEVGSGNDAPAERSPSLTDAP